MTSTEHGIQDLLIFAYKHKADINQALGEEVDKTVIWSLHHEENSV